MTLMERGINKVRQNLSSKLIDEMDNPKYRSMYDHSPFGLSVGRIEQKYEHWRTVRKRAMEIKEKQFEELHKELETKEKKREKNYHSFVKKQKKDNQDKFHKWTTREHEARQRKQNEFEELDNTSFNNYRTEIREIRKREREQARSKCYNNLIYLENFNKVTQEASEFVREVNSHDKEKEFKQWERLSREYSESENRLKSFNNKLQVVNDKLQENYRKRIDSLKERNDRTYQIKVQMDKEMKEKHERDFQNYFLKQNEYMKRMKACKKALKSKSLTYINLASINKLMNLFTANIK